MGGEAGRYQGGGIAGVVLVGFAAEEIVCARVYHGEGWAAPVVLDVDVDAAEEGN